MPAPALPGRAPARPAPTPGAQRPAPVRSALLILQAEGLIEGHQGTGTYVAGSRSWCESAPGGAEFVQDLWR
ncbi:hypothetical protein DDE19_03040 [Micromonospora ureilytica]|uniref:Uncharacterized protein n=1 Tax=Micromonospora ureilytica TaxID=709868 RepID=A0A3N9Y4E8_9ACTN|nr:hypothetical protein DDE19_03040 [Micromonospora ureilytica]